MTAGSGAVLPQLPPSATGAVAGTDNPHGGSMQELPGLGCALGQAEQQVVAQASVAVPAIGQAPTAVAAEEDDYDAD